MPTPQLIVTNQARVRRRRWLRALYHDTRALLQEFRWPLLAFVLAVFFGGWLYGELMVFAGYERMPYFDLPYIMLALMILESPMDVPREWYLVIFWYILPPIGVYIIGRGAVDFVRLFFNRNERRNAWELAVASTYHQHIIVAGVGHVGMRVVRTLAQMGFEVIALDVSMSVEAGEELRGMDVPIVLGDARTTLAMRDAGLERARALVVCTSNDHINLEITMRARDLNPNIRIVTRMWDDRFAEQLKRFLNVEVMSASDLAAPAFAGSAVNIEVTQTLRVAGEEFSMIQIRVAEGSFMDGQTIAFLQEDEGVDIVLHGHNGQPAVVHPSGNQMVMAGDALVLFARHSKITEIVARNRPQS